MNDITIVPTENEPKGDGIAADVEETVTAANVPAPVPATDQPVSRARGRGPRGAGRQGGRPGRAGRPGRGGDRGRGGERSEFDQVTIAVRRVARVMAGGRRFSFSVALVIGDKKGRVGVGLGKGADTALAIEKATRDARRNLVAVSRTKNNSISYETSAKYASSTVTLMPSPGRGLVAGSATRTVLELAGVTDVATKILSRSKNKLTLARATVEALKKLAVR